MQRDYYERRPDGRRWTSSLRNLDKAITETIRSSYVQPGVAFSLAVIEEDGTDRVIRQYTNGERTY